MKKVNKTKKASLIGIGLLAALGALVLASCSNKERVQSDKKDASGDSITIVEGDWGEF